MKLTVSTLLAIFAVSSVGDAIDACCPQVNAFVGDYNGSPSRGATGFAGRSAGTRQSKEDVEEILADAINHSFNPFPRVLRQRTQRPPTDMVDGAGNMVITEAVATTTELVITTTTEDPAIRESCQASYDYVLGWQGEGNYLETQTTEISDVIDFLVNAGTFKNFWTTKYSLLPISEAYARTAVANVGDFPPHLADDFFTSELAPLPTSECELLDYKVGSLIRVLGNFRAVIRANPSSLGQWDSFVRKVRTACKGQICRIGVVTATDDIREDIQQGVRDIDPLPEAFKCDPCLPEPTTPRPTTPEPTTSAPPTTPAPVTTRPPTTTTPRPTTTLPATNAPISNTNVVNEGNATTLKLSIVSLLAMLYSIA